MRARLGVAADFFSDRPAPADLWAYSWLAVLATMSNVAEAQTSTRMDRFIAPSENQLPKVSSFYPSKAETKPRSVEHAAFFAPPESKEVACIPIRSDSCLVERVHYRSWCRHKICTVSPLVWHRNQSLRVAIFIGLAAKERPSRFGQYPVFPAPLKNIGG